MILKIFAFSIAMLWLVACSENKTQNKPIEQSKPTNQSVDTHKAIGNQTESPINASNETDPAKVKEIARSEAKKYCDFMDKLITDSKNDREKINFGIVDYNVRLEQRLKNLLKNPDYQQAFDDAMNELAPEVEKKHPDYFNKLKK